MLHFKKYELGKNHDWVVFVHGAGGSSSIWYKQIRDFKKHFNVLLIDLRGHGLSQNILKVTKKFKYTFENVSLDIIEVLDFLVIRKAHFVGISLGTILIRTIADMAPDRIASMVMGGAITRLNFRSRFFVMIGNISKHIVPFIWLYKFFAWIIMPRKRHKEGRLLFIGQAKKVCQNEFMRWFKLTWEVKPLLTLFEEKEPKKPTLYIMGEEDYMFLPAVRNLMGKHKNSHLKVISNTGHVCNVENPILFNKYAISFIKAHPGYQLTN